MDETNLVEVGGDGWVNIGAAGPAESGTFFSGLIDDVRIYNRVVKP